MEKTEEKIEGKDDKGVPLENRMKEYERKMEEKFAKELAQTRQELQELKNMRQFENGSRTEAHTNLEKNDPKERLMKFVEDPDAYIENKYRERRFQEQVGEAETWLAGKEGYNKDVRARIDAIIFENKLNTPYHMPMDRAKSAWKLYEAELKTKGVEDTNDERRREAAVNKSSGEGAGKSVPKNTVNVHNELIKKLAAAEAKGDMEESIRLMDMLQDHPMQNSVIRGM